MNIPEFPDSIPVSLDHKSEIEEIQKAYPPPVSDWSFNNLFGWKDYFNYRITRINSHRLIYYEKNSEIIFLPSLGAVPEIYQWIQKQNKKIIFRYVPESDIHLFPSDRFFAVQEPDFSDYIYKRESLANLKGRRYQPKRNLIKQFEKKYSWHYEILKPEHFSDLGKFLEQWKPVNAYSRDLFEFSRYCMSCRLLEHYTGLSVFGGILYADNMVAGFVLASILPAFRFQHGIFPTAVMHVENASLEYKGAYQMINQLFCRSLPEEIIYINREEDLGIEGLRQAKQSYHPEFLINKFRIESKG